MSRQHAVEHRLQTTETRQRDVPSVRMRCSPATARRGTLWNQRHLEEPKPAKATNMTTATNPPDTLTQARTSLYDRFAARISVEDGLSRKLVSYQGTSMFLACVG